MIKKKNIIIDTDPGIDDAVALVIAMCHEEIDLKLITTVAGNVSADKTTKNALKLVEFLDKNIPVAKGAVKPLIRELEDASDIHGNSGLDGYDFYEPKRNIESKHAVEEMRDVILNSEEPITLVPIAPLTNIALLLSLYPECKNNIEKIVLMGGSASGGNHTPAAEFNIFVDPEAAKIVFKSEIDIVMCGLDITNKAVLTSEDVEEIKSLNKTGNMLYSLFQHYRSGDLKKGLKMHDSCAIAYLLRPDLFKTKSCYVDVETSGSYTAGFTVVDFNGYYGKKINANICIDIDVEKFRMWIIDALKRAI